MNRMGSFLIDGLEGIGGSDRCIMEDGVSLCLDGGDVFQV